MDRKAEFGVPIMRIAMIVSLASGVAARFDLRRKETV
jgi:hypothetical protein